MSAIVDIFTECKLIQSVNLVTNLFTIDTKNKILIGTSNQNNNFDGLYIYDYAND
jgi:hypothetical protein